jgi:co-chaperonin GroES (HSP10)
MTIRPLRGRVVVREHKSAQYSRYPSIVIPDTVMANERSRLTHTGTVLALGPPVRTKHGHEVPHECKPGDTVQFHFEATEEGRKTKWDDGAEALVMAQREIDAVITCDCEAPFGHVGDCDVDAFRMLDEMDADPRF